ncbi:hypothetical protein FO519_006679 [Halicephalobus sp. NKZ332]|nr:hypothetical protein FO519_006679 [Halicephalobus sp. NKZ332]
MCTVSFAPIDMQRFVCLAPKLATRSDFRSSTSSSTDSSTFSSTSSSLDSGNSSGNSVSLSNSDSSGDSELGSPTGQPEFREINQEELAELLKKDLYVNHSCSGKPSNLLILDCRNFADYNHCHVAKSINILYARMQRKRLLDNKLCCESLVNQHLKALGWNNIDFGNLEGCDVVLYAGDEKTQSLGNLKCPKLSLNCGSQKEKSLNFGSQKLCSNFGSQKENVQNEDECSSSERCIRFFYNKLRNGSKLKCKRVMLLKGSFLEFQNQYPDLCESNEQHLAPTPSVETAPVVNAVPGFPSLMNWSTGTQKTGLNINNNNPENQTGQTCNNSMMLVLDSAAPNRLSLPSSLSHPCLSTAPVFPTFVRPDEDEEQSNGPTKILDFMFLGSQQDALDPEVLKKHGISKIINLSENCPRPESVPNNTNHFLRIPIKDSYSAKLLPHFDAAYEFLETAKRSNEKVLVHCLAGISRSATLAIAYIMRSMGKTSDEAYKFVKARRPSISPNFNFLGQLLEYEKQLKERHILSPGRPHSFVCGTPEPSTSNDLFHNPSSDKICKSASSDFVLLAPKREVLKNENGKRTIDVPLSFPERPRQLMKTGDDFFPIRPGSIPLTPSTAPIKGELPSPSTEFERLDISNPIFPGLPSLKSPEAKPEIPTSLSVENPMFNLEKKIEGKKPNFAPTKMLQNHCSRTLMKYLKKRPKQCIPTSSTTTPITACSSRCVIAGTEPRSLKLGGPLGRRLIKRPLFSPFLGSGLQTVPDLPDDELVSTIATPSNSPVKSSGSLSAPPGGPLSPGLVRQKRAATVPNNINIEDSSQDPYRDPERDSIGSASEIAVN